MLDAEKTAIDWNRFVVVQTLRVGFKRLLQRPTFKGVHNLVPPCVLDVPLYVLLHVGKGSKFVPAPAAKRVTAKSLAAGLQQLRRSLLVSKTFLHREAAIPSARCRIKSD